MTNVDCPRCGAAMRQRTLDGVHGRVVTIDSCEPCHAFWFDEHESLQLAPRAVLALFRMIATATAPPSPPPAAPIRCPRCQAPLRHLKDMQRTTRFEYFKCPREHGRLISFVEFLKKKDFIKPLTPRELADLRDRLEPIDCANCGAPLDLVKGAQCAHCGSPLSIVDVKHLQQLIEQLTSLDKP